MLFLFLPPLLLLGLCPPSVITPSHLLVFSPDCQIFRISSTGLFPLYAPQTPCFLSSSIPLYSYCKYLQLLWISTHIFSHRTYNSSPLLSPFFSLLLYSCLWAGVIPGIRRHRRSDGEEACVFLRAAISDSDRWCLPATASTFSSKVTFKILTFIPFSLITFHSRISNI